MEPWAIWLIAAGILLIVEVCTQMMWALCMTVGALAGMALSLLGVPVIWQVTGMVATAVGTYAAVLPVFRRWHRRRSEHAARTGMDALLGRRATVTHEIKPGALGRARIDGDSWQVRAPGAVHTIPAGTEVSVTAYDSIILTVEELKTI